MGGLLLFGLLLVLVVVMVVVVLLVVVVAALLLLLVPSVAEMLRAVAADACEQCYEKHGSRRNDHHV